MELKTKQDRIDALMCRIAQLQDPEDCRIFFEDLCTAKELSNMAERCYAAQLLSAGMTYNQVMELADISSATLSRVSRCVQYGKGYAKQFK